METLLQSSFHSQSFAYPVDTTIIDVQDREFFQLIQLIHEQTGIIVKRNKRKWLENRLSNRLKWLGLISFSEYFHYLKNHDKRQSELVECIDAVTTNRTSFFRETKQFHFLEHEILPEFVQNNQPGSLCSIWSCACSSGEESYSLAMCLSEFFHSYPQYSFTITGTDISEAMLRHCNDGIYSKEKVYPVPPHLLSKYMSNHGESYKVNPVLSDSVNFLKLNLSQDFHHAVLPYKVIFCRNVLMYFDNQTQKRILNQFCEVLKPGGYLLIGFNERLHEMNAQLELVSPSIYRKPHLMPKCNKKVR